MPSFKYTDILSHVNRKIFGKKDMLINARETINEGVREALVTVKFRSAKRLGSLPGGVFQDIYDYPAPTDLQGTLVIDVMPQVNRSQNQQFRLTTLEEFDRRKAVDRNIIAFSEFDAIKTLKISAQVTDKTLSLDPISSSTGFTAFGDASAIDTDSDQWVRNSSSVAFDITSAGGTTAGIQKSTLPVSDITDWFAAGYGFVWVYIQSITGLTNWKVRIGSGSSNYYEWTMTSDSQGNAFAVGWNLLKFQVSAYTKTGSPVASSITYASIFMTKLGSKQNELDYRVNWLVLKRGQIFNLPYYSKYLWLNNAGVRIENSTADDDTIFVDNLEFNIIGNACAYKAAYEVREGISIRRGVLSSAAQYEQDFQKACDSYQLRYPDESLMMMTTYHDLDSLNRSNPNIDQI